MKKIINLIIVFMISVGLVVPAYGVDTKEESNNSLTIENTGESLHTFELYQIFKGYVHEKEDGRKILSNIEWGSSIEGKSGELSQGEFNSLRNNFKDEKTSKKWINDNKKIIVNPLLTKDVEKGKKFTFENLEPGYYLVRDKEGSQSLEEVNLDDANKVYTDYILEVVGNVESKTKLDVPTMKVEVLNQNDSNNEEGTFGKVADYDIGDEVEFRLEGTLPKNIEDYSGHYKYNIFSEFDERLSIKSPNTTIVQIVSKDGKATRLSLNVHYTVKYLDNKLSVVLIGNSKGLLKEGSKVVVNYKALLNEKAKENIGEKIVNKSYLQYSNNVNDKFCKEMSNTLADEASVYTYKFTVNTTDGKNVLSDAKYKLEKKMADGTLKEVEILSEDGKTVFGGFDEGSYILTQINPPSGFNVFKPIEFEVTANIKDKTITITTDNESITFDTEEGALTTTVVSKAGFEFPETGGMGTTLLYILGLILIICSLGYIVAEKKLENKTN